MAGNKTILEEFVSILGWEIDKDELDGYEKTLERVKDTTVKVTKAAIAGASFLAGFITVVNKGTYETEALASAMGSTAENVEALSNALKPVGLDTENVIDLMEELNNKMGESKGLNQPMTAVAESLRILKLRYSEIKDLAPEEQFTKIIDAAKDLEDQQKAVAAVDMLTGAEANRIIGFLRAQGLSLEDIMWKYKELNLLNEEGREGAREYSKAFFDMSLIVTSISKLFSGLAGMGLKPLIDDMITFVKANRSLVQIKIKEFAEAAVGLFTDLYRIIKFLVEITYNLIGSIGGLRNAFILLMAVMSGIVAVKAVAFFQALVAQVSLATAATNLLNASMKILRSLLLGLKVGAGLLLAYLVIQDLYTWSKGGKSFFGEMSKEFEKLLDSATEYWANVFGMRPDEFQYNVIRFMDQEWTQFFKDAYEWWTEWFRDVARDAGNWISDMMSSLKNTFTGTWEEAVIIAEGYIAYLFDTFIPGYYQELVTRTKEIGDLIYQFFSDVWSSVLSSITGLWDSIVNWIQSSFYSLIDGFKKSLLSLFDILPDSIKTELGINGGAGDRGPLTGGLAPVATGGVTSSSVANSVVNSSKNIVSNFTGSPVTLNFNSNGSSLNRDEIRNTVKDVIATENRRAFESITTGRKY